MQESSTTQPETRKSTLRAASVISAAVMMSRILGLVRESLFAALFGASRIADAFVLAFRIPNLLREVFAEGAMSSAFVPTFTDSLQNDSREQAYALGNLLITGLLLITGSLAVLGIFFADVIVDLMAPGFGTDPEKRAIAIRCARIMMPFLPLIVTAAAAMGMLNAQRRFFLPALAPAMFNVISIMVGLGLWLSEMPEESAVLGWSIGAVIGAAMQLAIQVPPLWKLGWRFRPTLKTFISHPGIRRIIRLMTPALIGLAAAQLNIFVNSIFASNLGDGPMSALSYAWRLFYLPLGLFGVAIATVTTTSVAEEAAKGEINNLRNRVAHSLKLTWMLTIPSACGLIVLSVPTIQLIYERGAFTPSNTELTAWVLMAYMIALAPFSSVKTMAPAFYALDKPRLPMIASILSVAVNIIFNSLTYKKLGAPGLALGMALGAIMNILLLGWSFRRLAGPMKDQKMILSAIKILASSVVCAATAWCAWRSLISILPASAGMLVVSLTRCLQLGIPIAIGVIAYLLTCRLLGLEEINEIIAPIRRRLRR